MLSILVPTFYQAEDGLVVGVIIDLRDSLFLCPVFIPIWLIRVFLFTSPESHTIISCFGRASSSYTPSAQRTEI